MKIIKWCILCFCFWQTCYGEIVPQNLSMQFQDIEVRKALQLLSEFTKKDFLISDGVTGKIALQVHQLDAEQILEIILKAKNLSQRMMHNVTIIAPTAEIMAQEQQDLQLQQQLHELQPLQTEMLALKYARAAEIAKLLQKKENHLLSAQGSVTEEVRTNSLIIQDRPRNIANIRALMDKLDMPIKQVMIDARLISVDKAYAQQLGIKLGLARAAQSAGAGIVFARIGKGAQLDVELSAMETDKKGEVISNPKIITADQHTALIQSGEEIPYQEATSSGATNVAFKKAVLSLVVVPKITPDQKILLALRVNQDKRGQVTNGVPAIETHQISTQVIACNGETIVLGGIYERLRRNEVQSIPFFSQLPLIGALFRHNIDSSDRKELIVFITPTIITHAS